MQLGVQEIQQLEYMKEVVWEAMLKIRELEGASDLTLNLEGSTYELDGIVKTSRKPQLVSTR